MKEPSKRNFVPPGGYFHYVDADSGLKLSHPHLSQLQLNAKKHRLANNYPIGANWTEQFEDNVCANTPTAECHERHEPSMLEKASMLGKALVRWAKSGFKVVSEEQYQARYDICAQCEYFGGQRQTTNFRCKKCGCKGSVKAALATEHCPLNKWGVIA